MKGYFFLFFLDYGLRDLNTAKPWAGSPALNRTMSWKYVKLWIFIFFLWLFCEQHLQIATQCFWSSIHWWKEESFKNVKDPIVWEFKRHSHPCWEGKITLTTWKSLATNGLGSEGKHDCTWGSLPLDIPPHPAGPNCLFPPFPWNSWRSQKAAQGNFCVCVCVCYYLLYVDFPLCLRMPEKPLWEDTRTPDFLSFLKNNWGSCL